MEQGRWTAYLKRHFPRGMGKSEFKQSARQTHPKFVVGPQMVARCSRLHFAAMMMGCDDWRADEAGWQRKEISIS